MSGLTELQKAVGVKVGGSGCGAAKYGGKKRKRSTKKARKSNKSKKSGKRKTVKKSFIARLFRL